MIYRIFAWVLKIISMKALKLILSVVMVAVASLQLSAQESVSYKISKKGLVRSKVAEDSTVEQLTVLKPILIFKGRYELGTESGDSRFALRNSRVGVQGDLSKQISYKFMVDFSDNGKLRVLDLYATIKPVKGLKLTFGQGGLPIFNSYTTSPNSIDFANRPFIGKYIFSSRDIGLTANYTIKQKGFPIAVEAGVYNGDGINNPVWTGTLAYSGRLLFGSMKGWRTSVKFLRSKADELENYYIWGADLRYENSDFKIEAEYMNKFNDVDADEIGDELYSATEPYKSLSIAYVQGLFKIPVQSQAFKRIEPCFRWDGAGYDLLDRGLGCNRATAGVNFVLNSDTFTSLFRVNYEHYFNNSKDMSPIFTSQYHNENKLSLELLIVF